MGTAEPRPIHSDLLTPAEVGAILRISRRHVRRLGATGVLDRIRIGARTTRYTADSVAQLIHSGNTSGHLSPGGHSIEGNASATDRIPS